MRHKYIFAIGRDGHSSQGIAARSQRNILYLLEAHGINHRHSSCYIVLICSTCGQEVGNKQVAAILRLHYVFRFTQHLHLACYGERCEVNLRDCCLELIADIESLAIVADDRGAGTSARSDKLRGRILLGLDNLHATLCKACGCIDCRAIAHHSRWLLLNAPALEAHLSIPAIQTHRICASLGCQQFAVKERDVVDI